MRISLTYLYTIFRYGYPPKIADDFKALSEIHRMGFHYLEMEGLGPQHLRLVYQNRQQLTKTLQEYGMHVHNFCVVDLNLVSLDRGRRQQALDRFKLGAELGDYLDVDTLHLASYTPPVHYMGGKPYQLTGGNGYCFPSHTQLRIPRKFDWNQVWGTLVSSCQTCADVAAEHGKVVIMEPRVGEIICSVDSLLRLIEHVGRANFKANFDTAHFSAQRENVPLALAKLRGHFANIHIADNNPVNTKHLPIGDGIVDWKEFFRVLKMMRYEGYLGLDLGLSRSLVQGYRKSVERIQSIASELQLRVEV
jgi:sugar phosphate isomerase/epimerase